MTEVAQLQAEDHSSNFLNSHRRYLAMRHKCHCRLPWRLPPPSRGAVAVVIQIQISPRVVAFPCHFMHLNRWMHCAKSHPLKRTPPRLSLCAEREGSCSPGNAWFRCRFGKLTVSEHLSISSAFSKLLLSCCTPHPAHSFPRAHADISQTRDPICPLLSSLNRPVSLGTAKPRLCSLFTSMASSTSMANVSKSHRY